MKSSCAVCSISLMRWRGRGASGGSRDARRRRRNMLHLSRSTLLTCNKSSMNLSANSHSNTLKNHQGCWLLMLLEKSSKLWIFFSCCLNIWVLGLLKNFCLTTERKWICLEMIIHWIQHQFRMMTVLYVFLRVFTSFISRSLIPRFNVIDLKISFETVVKNRHVIGIFQQFLSEV